MIYKKIFMPLDDGALKELKSGDRVLLNGDIYTARDKAHQRLVELAENGIDLPFELKGSFIYYAGPSPAPPGKIIGAAGPTTSYRMDAFTEFVMKQGVKGLIGKGKRNSETRELIKEYNAVYFSSFGGAAAYISRRITHSVLIAFEDLGPEAIYRLTVKDFPLIVINDSSGGDLYENLGS